MQLVLLFGAACSAFLVLRAASSRQESPAAPPLPPETKRLEAWVGTWDAEVSMMGQTTKGTETCRIECGGHWLVTEHSGSFMGAPFQGKGLTGYDASKGAVNALCRQLAVELAALGFTTAAVAPGLVETPLTDFGLKSSPTERAAVIGQIPIRRIATVEDVAWWYVFLASAAQALKDASPR